RERVLATLRGEPTDRVPYSFWRHFYPTETSAEGLAGSMVEWTRRHELDFLKVNPRAQYHAEVWGSTFDYSGQEHVKPTPRELTATKSGDLRRVGRVGLDNTIFQEQLEAIRQIRVALGPDIPIIETVFSPLSVLGYLAPPELVASELRSNPDESHEALDNVTESFIPFCQACLEAGADGLFFATTAWATYNVLTSEEYATFGRPYDLRVLEAVSGAPFNVLHVCRDNSMLFELADYPAPAVNWAVCGRDNPTLTEARTRLGGKALIGGVSNDALTGESPTRASAEAKRSIEAAGRQGFFVGADCSIPTTSRDENVQAVRRVL
ncbi:MAG: hypothetical protein HY329_26405, partial [Chloroflexi bacterium]|nr:hypothetical protein [Chloroflexota bacterium]